MSLTSSRLAYTTHFELLDKAIAGNGVRVKCKNIQLARRLRLELYYARKIDRDENRKVEEEGTVMHGRSIYDPIRCTAWEDERGQWWLYIQKVDLSTMEMEELDAPSRPTPREDNPEPLPPGLEMVQGETPSELHGSDQEGFEEAREPTANGGVRR